MSRPNLPGESPRLAAGNQAVAMQELAKFALYLGADPAIPGISIPTRSICWARTAEADLMRLGDLALSGQMVALLEALGRLPTAGRRQCPFCARFSDGC